MKFTPYPFQRAGIEWIVNRPACALFWGMGTGKTVTTLTAVSELIYERLDVRRVLVIAPLRVARDTWAREAAKWDHLRHLRIARVLGSLKERAAALEQDADVYVVNRENVVWLIGHLGKLRRSWPFDMVVIDELSSFKDHASKRFKALRRVRGLIKRVVGLTGTPAPNGLIDLWPQIYLLDQGMRLGASMTLFRAKYFRPDKSNGHIVYSYTALPGAPEAIYDRLSDLCMSLRKEDVLSLPGQIYETVEITPPPSLLKQYRQFERDQTMEAADEGGEIVALSAASLTGKLLQFANGAIYDADKNVRELHTLKLDALEDLIEAALGEPVLVFYAFRHDRDRIMARLPCRELATSDDIDAWNRREIPIALAHPASVGHGLNLQQGGHIIVWFGLTWSLELYQQANERLNRPGQTDVCRIYHLIVKGTHDERVMQALENKDTSQRALIDALKAAVGGKIA